MKKDTINVYWAPYFDYNPNEPDWTLLYPKPKNLFSKLVENKDPNSGRSSYFACPAVANKMKNTYIFSNSCNASYVYDENSITPTSESWIAAAKERPAVTNTGPLFIFSLRYLLFADQPLDTFFSPPYFHKSEYTKYGAVVPGEFDIGQWLRPYIFELQTWSPTGEIHLKEDEPLFYTEFKTDKKIKMNRFVANEQIMAYSRGCTNSLSLFGRGESLIKRYGRFKDVGLREKVLKEINNSLVED
jgi:hypothetical protein